MFRCHWEALRRGGKKAAYKTVCNIYTIIVTVPRKSVQRNTKKQNIPVFF